jgi:tellurite methyltransferase
MPNVGELIRRYRQRRFLTQKELAERLSVRYQTVQDWEAGRSRPRLRHLKLLVETLGIPAEALVGEDIARAA